MRQVLLIISVVGFIICFLSIDASLGRPTSFDLLNDAVQKAEAQSPGLAPESRKQIQFCIGELRRFHLAEVDRCATAHQIALGGLFGISLTSLFLYVYSRRKCV